MFNFALQKSRRLAVHTIIIFSIAWVLIAIFAVAFQCKLPQSWAVHSDRCFNQVRYGGSFIATELIWLGGFLELYWSDRYRGWYSHGHTSNLSAVWFANEEKPQGSYHDSICIKNLVRPRNSYTPLSDWRVTRLIPIIVTRLVFINKAKDSHGHFADNFNIAVLTIVHTNLNVIVTCLPFIKPVTDNLQAGILARNVYGDTYLQIAPLIPWNRWETRPKQVPPKAGLFTLQVDLGFHKRGCPVGSLRRELLFNEMFLLTPTISRHCCWWRWWGKIEECGVLCFTFLLVYRAMVWYRNQFIKVLAVYFVESEVILLIQIILAHSELLYCYRLSIERDSGHLHTHI